MDFVSLAVLSTLSIKNYSAESYIKKCTNTVSLSALLKASQRLSSMTDITGSICVTKGKFFSRNMNPDIHSSEIEESKNKNNWKQEGMNAELIISLNIILNMYVLQIYVQDKANASHILHMGRKESQVKRSFYINYDLHFKYVDAESLGISKGNEADQNEGSISVEVMKTIKNFVFYWKHTIDPDNLVYNFYNLG